MILSLMISREFTGPLSFLLEGKEKIGKRIFLILKYSFPARNVLQSDFVDVIWHVCVWIIQILISVIQSKTAEPL